MSIDASGKKIIAVFHKALDILDSGEGQIRLAIENNLADVTGPSAPESLKAVKRVMKEIETIRVKSIKDAFKHLRANLPYEE
jgi:hypothetical protein